MRIADYFKEYFVLLESKSSPNGNCHLINWRIEPLVNSSIADVIYALICRWFDSNEVLGLNLTKVDSLVWLTLSS